MTVKPVYATTSIYLNFKMHMFEGIKAFWDKKLTNALAKTDINIMWKLRPSSPKIFHYKNTSFQIITVK